MKGLKKYQTGVATLATAIILLLVSTLIVFAVGKAVLQDQKGMGDELRIKEAYQAAQAGLEYGMSRLASNKPDSLGIGNTADGTLVPDPTPPGNIGPLGSGNTYSINVTYERLVDRDPTANRDRPIFRVSSTAQPVAGQETHITRTVSTLVLRTDAFGNGLGNSGPILLEGEMSDTLGSGDIVPGPNGVVITSLQGDSIDAIEDPSAAVDTHGGEAAYGDSSQPSLAMSMFGVDLQGTALDDYVRNLIENSGSSNLHYYDDPADIPGNFPTGFDAPGEVDELIANSDVHLVYIASQYPQGHAKAGQPLCPKLNGDFWLLGMIYVAAPDCDDVGFGNCHIYGTAAFTGNVSHLNANCQFIGLDLSAETGDKFDHIATISPVPGTWRDFQGP